MNSDAEKLLDDLRSSGLQGEQLAKEIQEHLLQGDVDFNVRHSIIYGEELMHLHLHFEGGPLSKTPSFTSYTAFYFGALQPDDKMINGIHVARLEYRMQEIDWEKLAFKRAPENAANADDLVRVINGIFNDLWKLTIPASPDGTGIQDRLRLTYLSDTVFDTPELEEKRRKGQTYDSSIHPHIAFQFISGRVNRLDEILTKGGFDYAESHLAEGLHNNPEGFIIEASEAHPEGNLFFKLPCYYENNRKYDVGDFEATLILHPLIEHGIFNGVDSAALEAAMARIDWNDNYSSYHFYGSLETPILSQDVEAVMQQLHELSADEKGSAISDKLQMKYWIREPYFNGLLAPDAKKQYSFLPKLSGTFPINYADPRHEHVISELYSKIKKSLKQSAVIKRSTKQNNKGRGI